MKKNNKLVNKTVELSLLKCVSAGANGNGKVYLPPEVQACRQIASHLTPGEPLGK
ncbi:hypothetical protein [Thalassomonas sp. RHCl1]|uniref:hypothetical protein n=1 Tax=Thalassomonas sp. RHCl1 TaxID=2995320 RepID=UPI00248D2026|nr:hypothetical protein [Thalassomonas sp. RHCl1]